MSNTRARLGHAMGAGIAALAALGGLLPAAAGAATPATAAGPQPCGNGALVVTAAPANSGAGHSGFPLLFRNRTGKTCTLHGYPGLDALGRHGRVLVHAKRTKGGYLGGGKLRTVRVRPGHFATAVAEYLNFNPHTTGPCKYSRSIAVTPANTSDSVRLPVSVSICSLQIHPTVAGTGGYKNYAAAQEAWIKGASADSANQGRFWHRARRALLRNGDPYNYAKQARQLRQLIRLPDANRTPAQNRRYRHDVHALNHFFNERGLYL